jgi:hypothetical protein
MSRIVQARGGIRHGTWHTRKGENSELDSRQVQDGRDKIAGFVIGLPSSIPFIFQKGISISHNHGSVLIGWSWGWSCR